MEIRDALDTDVPAIVDLRNALLSTTTIEWSETPHTVVEGTEWLRRQRAVGHPVLVAVVARDLVGWCSFGDFRDTRSGRATAPRSSIRSMSERTIGEGAWAEP